MNTIAWQRQRLRIGPAHRLQREEAQQAFVLLYPEGMITLNDSASEILKRCDGSRDMEGIIADLLDRYPDADLRDDVEQFLGEVRERGWIHCD